MPEMVPAVVTWATSQRPSSSGRALDAVFKMYHEPPTMVFTFSDVPPVVKYSEMVVSRPASWTKDGSTAPSTDAAGPSRPRVA